MAMYWLNTFLTLLTAVYVLLFLVVAGTMLWLPRSYSAKAICFLLVCALFAMPLIYGSFEKQERAEHRQMIVDRFLKLCEEQAGEKIHRVVEGVEGFLILKPRQPTRDDKEYYDQYWMGDPYGHSDLEAEKPEHVFLTDWRGYESDTMKLRPLTGYNYIEIQLREYDHPERFKRMEVVARISDKDGDRLQTRTDYSPTARSRYAYDWEDISTEEDRRYWIAGGRMRVIDLVEKTVIAERTGYMIDMGQGTPSGARKPWMAAEQNACPRFENRSSKAQEFVSKALKAARGAKRD